jgi:hypothetical protein
MTPKDIIIKAPSRQGVTFGDEDGYELNVCWRDGVLRVSGDKSIKIEPMAANNCLISMRDMD